MVDSSRCPKHHEIVTRDGQAIERRFDSGKRPSHHRRPSGLAISNALMSLMLPDGSVMSATPVVRSGILPGFQTGEFAMSSNSTVRYYERRINVAEDAIKVLVEQIDVLRLMKVIRRDRDDFEELLKIIDATVQLFELRQFGPANWKEQGCSNQTK